MSARRQLLLFVSYPFAEDLFLLKQILYAQL